MKNAQNNAVYFHVVDVFSNLSQCESFLLCYFIPGASDQLFHIRFEDGDEEDWEQVSCNFNSLL